MRTADNKNRYKMITINQNRCGPAATLLLLALSMAQPAEAITTYSMTVTGTCWSGSHTIYASDSGMSTKYYAATVFDSNGSYIARGHYGATIDTTSYNLTLTFGSA